ncbi:HAD domain-containing protein [Labedaea rhizosphaerae]|uniref:Secreted protein n=1 Tax=Labedaea rhizosphaerae TaxID=598644 RepID=A0A4R6SHR5_LABRH|nr:HAD domain-containing protein [Labedaea rhizosphaerae]TDQ01582.1 hypothetical protein EV186_1021451 [Labedaea rhizosphaerae]
MADPLLFLDVDGPLIPFGGTHDEDSSLPARVDPALGPLLRALPCELVWATTWMEDANERIAPILGLPPLPMIGWPGPSTAPPGRLQWKTETIVGYASGRPFVWIDDEFGFADIDWVAAAHPAPALLHHVDPSIGLTLEDLATVEAWLGQLGSQR